VRAVLLREPLLARILCTDHWVVFLSRFASAYKTARSSTADALLNERGTIDSSHRMTDDLLKCVPTFGSIEESTLGDRSN
jgi:hypothetical protein